eukprot:m.127635 g.127635  ORF g.127635 m.127635 type:complete len:277 (+) comp14713_c0_seq5:73-903(+)
MELQREIWRAYIDSALSESEGHGGIALNLCSKGIDGEILMKIVEALPAGAEIDWLWLDNDEFEGNDCHALQTLLAHCLVSHLSLNGTTIGAAGAHFIAEALHANPPLRLLHLSSAELDDGVMLLAAALTVNTNLVSLRLSGNGIRREGACALAAALHINHTLQDLDLSSNAIGAGGAEALAAMLFVNSTLTSLNLYDCALGNQGLLSIAAVLSRTSYLKTLSVGGNGSSYETDMTVARAAIECRSLLSITGLRLPEDDALHLSNTLATRAARSRTG